MNYDSFFSAQSSFLQPSASQCLSRILLGVTGAVDKDEEEGDQEQKYPLECVLFPSAIFFYSHRIDQAIPRGPEAADSYPRQKAEGEYIQCLQSKERESLACGKP